MESGRDEGSAEAHAAGSERSEDIAYDLLIKNGRIIDGSGRPAFSGGVGVAGGKIVALGRLDGPARRTAAVGAYG
jgi:N-acyl-D-aspartate/D-glutamate deacylase